MPGNRLRVRVPCPPLENTVFWRCFFMRRLGRQTSQQAGVGKKVGNFVLADKFPLGQIPAKLAQSTRSGKFTE